MGTAFLIEGTGSELDSLSSYVQHADYGVYADGDCEASLTALLIENCNYGLYSHTTGNEEIRVQGGGVKDSITWDIYITESTATLVGSGMAVDEDKLYFDNAKVYLAHMPLNTGDEGLGIKGELHVGSPERGAESVFGEGDSYTRGLLAYTYDAGLTTYTDISADVKSSSGSTFTFPGIDVNDAIYISSDLIVGATSDYHQFFGIKMAMTAKGDNLAVSPNISKGGGGDSKMLSVLEQIAKKDSNVYMDSSKVGYAESLSYSKL